jgi:soluble lytic murein transglycosylase
MVNAFESGQVIRAGRLARTLQAHAEPDSEGASIARLVELFALLRQQKAKESREVLDRIAEHGPNLGTYGLFLRICVTSAARTCVQAEKLMAQIPTDSIFRSSALARLANCWLHTGEGNQAHAAVDAMEAQAESESRLATAALLRARVAESLGSRHEARDLYRRVLVRFPLTSAAQRAARWLDHAASIGMRIRPFAPEELLPRAECERASLRSEKARRTYAAVIEQSRGRRRANLRHQAELGLAELDLVDRQYDRALARIREVERASDNSEVLAQAAYLRGDILSRRGRIAASLNAYDTVLASFPNTAYAPEAALAAARLAYAARDIWQARRFVEWMLANNPEPRDVEVISGDGARRRGYASAGVRDHARWLKAWIERRTGGPLEVIDSYLAEIDGRSELAQAALYWRMRLALDAGRLFDAEIFTALLNHQAPTSYYALAASDRLARAHPAGATRLTLPAVTYSAVPNPPPPATEPKDLAAALVLAEHGLHSEAQRIVRLVPAHQLSPADRVAAGWLYRRSGDIHRAVVVTRRVTGSSDAGLLQLAYPRPFADVVTQAAIEYGVTPALIFAVIRNESAFDPDALSPRRARGLMQMIPPTARRMARLADLRRFRQRQLFEPEISIRLGALYLSALLEQFDGSMVAAVASYHAGEHRVQRWLAERAGLEADELIEEIPLTTTRGYVKKVLASYGVYRLLYDGVDEALGLCDGPRAEGTELSMR